MAILHNLGIETEAVHHNARPGTLYDEVPQHVVSQGMRSNSFVSKDIGKKRKSCCFIFLFLWFVWVCHGYWHAVLRAALLIILPVVLLFLLF